MTSVPSHIQLWASGGAQKFELGGNIVSTSNPLQGLNYMYAAGNRRTIVQFKSQTALSGTQTVFERVPISLTPNKTAIAFWADIGGGELRFEVFNAADVSQGFTTIAVGARAVTTSSVTGLTPASVEYATVTITNIGTVTLYAFQAVEVALTAI